MEVSKEEGLIVFLSAAELRRMDSLGEKLFFSSTGEAYISSCRQWPGDTCLATPGDFLASKEYYFLDGDEPVLEEDNEGEIFSLSFKLDEDGVPVLVDFEGA